MYKSYDIYIYITLHFEYKESAMKNHKCLFANCILFTFVTANSYSLVSSYVNYYSSIKNNILEIQTYDDCYDINSDGVVNVFDAIRAKKDELYVSSGNDFIKIFKSIAVIGDSLSSGEIVTNAEGGGYNFNDCYDYSWLSFIARNYNFEVMHYSRGGMTTASWYQGYSNNIKKMDCYIIALGTNDYNQNVPFDQFKANYKKIIERVRECNPNSCIFTMSLYEDELKENKIGNRKNYNDIIKEISKEYELCYYIDFVHNTDYICKWNDFYCYGGHYNTIGYFYISEEIKRLINKQIELNIKEFSRFSLYNYD